MCDTEKEKIAKPFFNFLYPCSPDLHFSGGTCQLQYCAAQPQQLHAKALKSRASADHKAFAANGLSQTNFFDLRRKHRSLHRIHAFAHSWSCLIFSSPKNWDALVVGAPWKWVWDKRRAVSNESARETGGRAGRRRGSGHTHRITVLIW